MSKHCPKCHQSFSDSFEECIYCGSELCVGDYVTYDEKTLKTGNQNRSIHLKIVYYGLDLKPQSIQLKCSKCKNIIEITENFEIFDEIHSEHLIIKSDAQLTCSCGNTHPFKKVVMEGEPQNNNTRTSASNVLHQGNTSNMVNVPKCPTCQSTSIRKISGLSKAGSVALWGIFSQKVKKQWHCNNCGSEW